MKTRIVAALALGLSLAVPVRSASELETFHLQWAWSMLGEFGVGGALEVGDVDRDGHLELVSLASSGFLGGLPRWQIHEYAGEVRQLWSSLPLEGQPRFLRLLPRTSVIEVLVFWDSVVKVYDGATRQLLREFPIPDGELRAARIDDLDGDGHRELVLCTSLDLFVMDPISGELIASRLGFGGTDIDFGQADDDPQLEIAIGGNGFGGLVLDGSDLTVDWAHLAGFGERVRMVDVDGDGSDEIVATSDSEERLRAIDPPTGETLWEEFIRFATVLESADLDGDGRQEVIVSGGFDSGVHVRDSADGELEWSVESPTGAAGATTVADLDGDGILELAWTTRLADPPAGGSLSIADTAARIVEYTAPDLRGPLRGLGAADLDLDGQIDLVGATAGGSSDDAEAGRVLTWRGGTGILTQVSEPLEAVSFGYRLGPTVTSQLDTDPQPEVCFTISSWNPASRLRCEDGLTREAQWEVPIPGGSEGISLLAAQLDADSIEEIIVGTSESKIYAFEGDTGWLKWGSPQLQGNPGLRDLAIGDVAGDSRLELIAGGADGFPRALLVLDAQTGLLALPEPSDDFGIQGLELVELDGDAQAEILVSRENGDIVPFDPTDQTFGSPLASFDPPVLGFRVADVTRDGVLDLIVTRFQGGLVVWDGAAGAVIWTSPWLGDRPGHDGTLWVANLDDDPILEIAVGMEAAIAILEAPLVALLRAGFETGDTSEWSASFP